MGVAVEVTRSDYTAHDPRYHASKSVDGAQVRRLMALASILEGRCRGEAAAHSAMDRQTLCDWVHRYNAAGIDGLKSHRSRGRAPAQVKLGHLLEQRWDGACPTKPEAA